MKDKLLQQSLSYDNLCRSGTGLRYSRIDSI